ncbi:MAG: hypothetical protein EOO59_03735 [Hymenobacter sp.]|nr:MAG: hypothetical protein EOO59_03735 [Hymenobacter sp.]
MRDLPYSLRAAPAATAPLGLHLTTLDAGLLARLLLHPPPQLLVDCGAQPSRRSLGVCHFLSLLLLLRRQGGSVWLCNVDPLLRRCLLPLGLGATFLLAE